MLSAIARPIPSKLTVLSSAVPGSTLPVTATTGVELREYQVDRSEPSVASSTRSQSVPPWETTELTTEYCAGAETPHRTVSSAPPESR